MYWPILSDRARMKLVVNYWCCLRPSISVWSPAMTGVAMLGSYRKIAIWLAKSLLSALNATTWLYVHTSKGSRAKLSASHALLSYMKKLSKPALKNTCSTHWRYHPKNQTNWIFLVEYGFRNNKTRTLAGSLTLKGNIHFNVNAR